MTLDEDAKRFAYAFLSDRQAYHTHKETSAYAIFLVETGLFSALVTTKTISEFLDRGAPIWALLLYIVCIWLLLHVFMRWQLRNRRIAALQVGTLISALLDSLQSPPPATSKSQRKPRYDYLYLDFIIPCPDATFMGDVELSCYPQWFRERYLAQQSKGTGASFGEKFPTYGSILMLITAVAAVVACGVR